MMARDRERGTWEPDVRRVPEIVGGPLEKGSWWGREAWVVGFV